MKKTVKMFDFCSSCVIHEVMYFFYLFFWQWLSSHLISGPMTECLRSMALAWALVRLDVGSLLMAKMTSPTPSLPSWQTEPPWTTLRTSMPEPSLIALTDMPANVRTHRHTHTQKHTQAQVSGGLAKTVVIASQTHRRSPKQTPRSGNNQHNQVRHKAD